MRVVGEYLSQTRKSKRISTQKASEVLNIKKEFLEALEKGEYQNLPEAAFVKGYLRSYALYLGLDVDHVLALYRREYDERNYPKKASPIENKKRLMLTPNRVTGLLFVFGIILFVAYLAFQYTKVLSAPRLDVFTPPDDLTTQVSVVQVMGVTEKDAIVSVEGDLVATDEGGNFSYQVNLQEGRNEIEIIASKKLSPKTKITKVVRLAP